MTLGVIASALFLLETGQMPFKDSAMAQAAETAPFRVAANRSEVNRYLQTLKTNTNQFQRAEAAKQLGILKDAYALDQLHLSLLSDISQQVRINAANAIARINKPTSVDKLMAAIVPNKGKADVQLAIIRAIGDMRQHSLHTVPKLVFFLKSPSPFVREATVEALWKIRPKDPRVVRVLNQLLAQEQEVVVKLTLAHVIADFKSPESVPVLIKVIKRTDENVDVKGLAQEALDKLAAMGITSAESAHVVSGGGGH